ncbi:cytochrome P450 [Hysterangium stoloniferum]|nr:cytochrome P450 [Hysterangium stoloniferum]
MEAYLSTLISFCRNNTTNTVFYPVVGLLIALFFLGRLISTIKRLPPGPRRLPVIGNVLQMPTVRPWETYSRWAKELNTEVLYLNVLGFPIVILDTAQAARDLLDKRGSLYSDRPCFPFFDLMGWSWAVQFMGYGEKFRRHRKPLQMHLAQSSVSAYWPIQRTEVRLLLKDLIRRPEDFVKHIEHAAAGMTITMLYGLRRGSERSSIIHIADEATNSLVAAGNFGDHLVDFFPILRHVPEWVPGAGFQKQAKEWRILCDNMVNLPFEMVKRQFVAGSPPNCLVSRLLGIQANGEDPDMTDYLIKSTAGVIYLGGADTTLSALYTFFLAMSVYPEVQKQAQEEIDTICLKKRLPEITDRDLMPYLDGLMRELFRWNPTTPLGVPHSVSENDVYGGLFIPKGSTVMANIWSICHDPVVYPEPYKFNPGRYLDDNGALDPNILDPRTVTFGFGRRRCPGRFLGESAVWTTVANILATFNISKATDPSGQEIEPSLEFTTGLSTKGPEMHHKASF